MTAETKEGVDPSWEVGAHFNVHHIGSIIQARIDELRVAINERSMRIVQLVPEIAGRSCLDRERRMAEVQFLRLQTEVLELTVEFTHAQAMVPDLGRPALVPHI